MTLRGVTRLLALLCAILLVAPNAGAQVSVDFPLTLDNLPSYDRVNGVSLPFGPTLSLPDDRLVATPVLTYRSHLGKIDPSLSIAGQILRDSTIGLSLSAARGTFTNDGWIRSDIINSVIAFGLGHDSRNYFRADRGEIRITSALHLPIDVSTVFAGMRTERAWSTGWRSGDHMGPFSVVHRRDTVDGIERPNPLIDAGHITSVIAGGRAEFVGLDGSGALDVLFEAAPDSPVGGSFQQLTVTGVSVTPTVAEQHLDITAHLVTTTTDSYTPRQRYAYLGGSGSLATVDMMSLGGDRLYFVDALYVVPIEPIHIPILGTPYIAPHFAAGAAGVGGFGVPVQNIGARLGVSVFTVDYVVNPRTHKHDFGFGVSIRP
jgi:hypothetical protein